MLQTFLSYILLIMAILLLVMLSQKLKIAYPIILVAGGLLLSLVPAVPAVSINPELIFIIFLPPLLYEAAWNTSLKSFWRFRRVIFSFATIIVILTSLVVAVVSSMLIPGFTMALGFLLGGIVSPPDAVSATAILKNVKVPKSLSAIIEGESLLNDASSLIVFRFALIAVDTGHFVFHEAALNFFLVVAMGIAIGVAIGAVYYAMHRWLPTNANIDVVLTITAPYFMYIAAESFQFSGVLAVVSGGLFLASKSHLFLSHNSRLQAGNVWSALGFVLNGLVFMLIGLALPGIVSQLGAVSLAEAIKYGLIITLVLIVTRILSTLGASAFTTFVSRFITTADSHPGWRGPLVFGWAGMRGVVSLAAALSIPLKIHSEDFPERNLILFISFMVILITLVFQGLTLPAVIRLLKLQDTNQQLPAKEQAAVIKKELAAQSLQLLSGEHSETLKNNRMLQQLQTKLVNDHQKPDEDAETEAADFKRIYLQLLENQRRLLHEMNKNYDTDEELIRSHQAMLDMEEEKLRMRYEFL